MNIQSFLLDIMVFPPLFGLLLSICILVSSRLKKKTITYATFLLYVRADIQRLGTKWEKKYGSTTSFYRRLDRIVRAAGKPFGIRTSEWLAMGYLIFVGSLLIELLINVMKLIMIPQAVISIAEIVIIPLLITSLPISYLYIQAERRRFILQYDFIQAFYRLEDLGNETPYDMVKLSLAGTRLLKQYTPNFSEFLHNPGNSLLRFAEEVGTEEAKVYRTTILYCITHPEGISDQIGRVQLGMKKLREAEEKKNTKKLETGFTAFIYGPFLVAIVALALPWFQFLKSALNGLLGE